jgi:hypothetical protein
MCPSRGSTSASIILSNKKISTAAYYSVLRETT